MHDLGIKVIMDAVNNTKRPFEEVKADVEQMSSGFKGLGGIMEGALGALTAYAGTKGLMGMVKASDDAHRTLAQAKFYLRGMGGDVEANMKAMKEWGTEMQRVNGIDDEQAVLIGSRLAPKIQDLNKIREWGNLLIKGERIGVLNAEQSTMMLTRAMDGNARALVWLAYYLGIVVPEFASMDTIMATIGQRLEGLTEELGAFDKSWTILKQNFGDFMERAGEPMSDVLGTIFSKINELIDRYPVLGTAISSALTMIATALMGLGVGLAVSGILKLLGLSVAFGPWGLAIGSAIGGVILFLDAMSKSGEEAVKAFEDLRNILLVVAGALVIGLLVTKLHLLGLALKAMGLSAGISAVQVGTLRAALLSLPMAIFITLAFVGFAEIMKQIAEYKAAIEGAGESATKLAEIQAEYTERLKKQLEEGKISAEEYRHELELMKRDADEVSKSIKEAQFQWILPWKREFWEIWKGIGGFFGKEFYERARGMLPGKQFGGYIPETGPYLLHRGEYVVPSRGAVSVYITGNTFMGDKEGAVKMGDLIVKVLQRNLKI